MCTKKYAELKYYEFATKIQNAVTKPTLNGTAPFMVMIIKTTEPHDYQNQQKRLSEVMNIPQIPACFCHFCNKPCDDTAEY